MNPIRQGEPTGGGAVRDSCKILEAWENLPLCKVLFLMVLMNDIAEIRERKQFLMSAKLIAKHKEPYDKGRFTIRGGFIQNAIK
ncbi:hypothetical protein MCU_01458 [Bartonella elizabethae Re6043vi]|uniref:Uncharacterized protein n=1 Tax=Bartonella elizabethae Re6043vi TaxID=1094554 RepID=A0ABN0GIQ5_BAREL|nr:hypothetical protein [Bartonella elizabethae]EJF82430.1 hypothetical protein MCU_01458 [Bartonella elizabethae Re6043vi]